MTRPRSQQRIAVFAFVIELARIHLHRLPSGRTAARARQNGFENDSARLLASLYTVDR